MKNINSTVQVGNMAIGAGQPLLLIAGPCVIEDEGLTIEIAGRLQELSRKLEFPFVFKASYDKANRTSLHSYRGPGLKQGLSILAKVKSSLGVKVLSDVHQISEIASAAEVLDIIQIPAFLCRQTDLLVAAAKTGKPINLKKGQFMAPWDMANAVEKCVSVGNSSVIITERGVSFGYNNLVVDFRGINIMQKKAPVVFDATHSVQLPGGAGSSSGGQREFAPVLARAAAAAGADGIFLEVHPDPAKALCDGPNSLPLDSLEHLMKQLKTIHEVTWN